MKFKLGDIVKSTLTCVWSDGACITKDHLYEIKDSNDSVISIVDDSKRLMSYNNRWFILIVHPTELLLEFVSK